MGFIKVVPAERPDDLKGIWKKYTDISKMKLQYSYKEIDADITNGTRLFLGENQTIALFSGEKLTDHCAGPGAFIYHDAFDTDKCGRDDEAALYEEDGKSLWADLRKNNVEKYTEAVGGGKTVCLGMRADKSIRVPFSFENGVYHEKDFDLNVNLSGTGNAVITAAEPHICYSHSGFSMEKMTGMDVFDLSEDEINEISAMISDTIVKVLEALEDADIHYDRLPYCPAELSLCLNNALMDELILGRALKIRSVEFSSFCPDEKSVQAIIRVLKGHNTA